VGAAAALDVGVVEAPDAGAAALGELLAPAPDEAVRAAQVLAVPGVLDVPALFSASAVPGRLEQLERRASHPATAPPTRSDCTRLQPTGSCSQEERIS
jgi:hypothetical protein